MHAALTSQVLTSRLWLDTKRGKPISKAPQYDLLTNTKFGGSLLSMQIY